MLGNVLFEQCVRGIVFDECVNVDSTNRHSKGYVHNLISDSQQLVFNCNFVIKSCYEQPTKVSTLLRISKVFQYWPPAVLYLVQHPKQPILHNSSSSVRNNFLKTLFLLRFSLSVVQNPFMLTQRLLSKTTKCSRTAKRVRLECSGELKGI